MTLVGALLLEWLFGDPRARWHPVAVFGALAQRVERALHADRRLRGVVAWVVTVAPLAAALHLACAAARHLDPTLGVGVGAAILWSTLGWRSLLEHVTAVHRAGGEREARARVSRIVGRDVGSMSGRDVRRAALESLAENASDAVVAPLLWGALGGPTAAAVYRMINTLDAMWGHRSPRYARFGWWAARADDVASWVPARLTAALYLVASPCRPRRALARQARAHPSVNAGWPESALAHALGVRLGGPVRRRGVEEQRPWMGPDGGSEPSAQSLEAGLRLTCRALAAASAVGVVATW